LELQLFVHMILSNEVAWHLGGGLVCL